MWLFYYFNFERNYDVLKSKPNKKTSWWRRLSSWSSEDVFIKMNIFTLLIRLQKTSSRRLDQDQYICLGHTSSRRIQDVFPRRLQNVLQKHLQDIFKTFSRRLQNVFKTSSRHLAKTFSRRLQNVFKTYHQIRLFFLTRFQDVFEIYSKRFWGVLQRWLSIEGFA